MPVADFLDDGADVYYEGDEGFVDPENERVAYGERYQQRLIDVGRFSNKWGWSYGVGYVPNFSGGDTAFGKVRYETAAMGLA